LTGWSAVSDFNIAWFSALSSERLCVFSLHSALYNLSIYIYLVKNFLTSFSLPFSERSLVGLALDLVDYQ